MDVCCILLEYLGSLRQSLIDIDVFTVATFDFLATEGELEHDSAIGALFFAKLGRWYLVDGHAP